MFKTGIVNIKKAENLLKVPIEDYNIDGKVLKNIKGKEEVLTAAKAANAHQFILLIA